MQTNKKEILEAIEKSGMIFLSAQPDTPYFHWQVELYMHQFAQHGIGHRCYALFGYEKEPSAAAKRLQKMYSTIRFYKDERKDRTYIPNIRPHIYKKFFKDNPKLGKFVFIHDSDIFLIRLPNFKKMIDDKLKRSYVSDTVSYIGFNYIRDCCKRYKKAHAELTELDLFHKMCQTVGVRADMIKKRNKHSGGAQYFYRDMDFKFWDDVEKANAKLYKMFIDYEKKYSVEKHIQKWTTDMWTTLWLYWKRGHNTVVDSELEFSWATGTVKDYDTKPIFHLAGITAKMPGVFHKGKYNNKSVFEAYNEDRGIFEHIKASSSTKRYTDYIKKYFNAVYAPEHKYLTDTEYFKTPEGKAARELTRDKFGEVMNNSSVGNVIDRRKFRIEGCSKFRITCDETFGNFDGDYVVDLKKKVCGKNVWRATNKKFIIYYNGKVWISTYASHEHEIGRNCGGLSSNTCEQPFYNDWNKDCLVTILCD